MNMNFKKKIIDRIKTKIIFIFKLKAFNLTKCAFIVFVCRSMSDMFLCELVCCCCCCFFVCVHHDYIHFSIHFKCLLALHELRIAVILKF